MAHTHCTADGVPIVPGLAVWNYDLARDRVVQLHHVEAERRHGVATGREIAWWDTERGIFDGPGWRYATPPRVNPPTAQPLLGVHDERRQRGADAGVDG